MGGAVMLFHLVLVISTLLSSVISIDSLDWYGGNDEVTTIPAAIRCLRRVHREKWAIRWDSELAQDAKDRFAELRKLSGKGKDGTSTDEKGNAVIILRSQNGGSSDPLGDICGDYLDTKSDIVNEIIDRGGSAEAGCHIKTRGYTTIVICLYCTGITGLNPVVKVY